MPGFSKSATIFQQFFLPIAVSKPDENEGKAAVPAAVAKQGSKKSASAKKAELNSKGALGSDMDAFTDLADGMDTGAPATAKIEEKKQEPVNHVSQDKTVDLSSSTSSLTSTDTLPVKEEAVMNHKEDTPPPAQAAATPVAKQIVEKVNDEAPLENGTSSQSGSQIKLKYTYKEGNESWCYCRIVRYIVCYKPNFYLIF